MSLRNRNKNLKETLLKREEEKKSKKGSGDKRFLNFFNLKENEKMTIRLLPDGGETDEYWREYDIHKIDAKGIDSIRCTYEATGESCPVCDYSYQAHLDGDKANNKKWRSNSKYIAQCLVIKAPFEVNEAEDGNPVKLFSMPYGVYEIIKEAIIEDRVGDLLDTDFIIKQTKGTNGYNNYDKSYFARDEDPLGDEVLDAIDAGEINLFDFATVMPEETTTDDMDEWLDKAIEIDKKASRRSTTTSHSEEAESVEANDKDEDEPAKTGSSSSLLKRLKQKDKNKE